MPDKKCSYKKHIEFADSKTSIDIINKNRVSTVRAEKVLKIKKVII